MYNVYFYTIISFLIIFFLFDKFVEYLNLKNWSEKIPSDLKEIYDEEKYKKSMQYDKEKNKFSNITSLFSFIIMLFVFIF
jgi:STE24 endopeptidase